ncbi:MAG: DUF1523 family protein [Deltaproteobacteria bacterium]|nr:DUF1523 family protein [Deltaproteobacteria bacterium]
MKASKTVKYGLQALFIVLVAAVLHYNLTRTQVAQIVGTDVKRLDSTARGKSADNLQGKGLKVRDVRFINAQSKSGKVEVFRNEDTGWGWPPYMKFNSADIAAEAQTFATAEGNPWVLLKYYGWRIHIFDMYPNIVSLKQVPRDYKHIPWFNFVFLLVLAGGSLFVIRRSRQLVNKIKARFKRDKTE